MSYTWKDQLNALESFDAQGENGKNNNGEDLFSDYEVYDYRSNRSGEELVDEIVRSKKKGRGAIFVGIAIIVVAFIMAVFVISIPDGQKDYDVVTPYVNACTQDQDNPGTYILDISYSYMGEEIEQRVGGSEYAYSEGDRFEMYILDGNINSFTYQEPSSVLGAKIAVSIFCGLFIAAGVCIVIMGVKGK